MKLDASTKRFARALGGESAFYAEPSPDGRWLARVRYPDGTLWRSRPDGSERLQLAGTPVEAHLPRWSPDGQRIVFVARTADDPQLVVRVVFADGSSAETIARPEKPGVDYWDPCWLPDGSILFDHLMPSHPAGLLRYDPVTRRAEPLPGAEAYRWASCSARGDLLAKTSEGGVTHFFVRKAGDAAWERLDVPQAGSVQYPTWRRDGRSFCGLWAVGCGPGTGRPSATRSRIAVSRRSPAPEACPWPRGCSSPGWASTRTACPWSRPTAARGLFTRSEGPR
jgi:dipeptidyl aminopeptidase/acylaminoacyl peptidase